MHTQVAAVHWVWVAVLILIMASYKWNKATGSYHIGSLWLSLVQVSAPVMGAWSTPGNSIVSRVFWPVLHRASIITPKLRLWVLIHLAVVPVLGVIHGVVIVIDARLLLYHLGPGAAAGHGAAEEDVDEEHDGEEDPEGNTEGSEPARIEISPCADSSSSWCRWPRLGNKDWGGGCHRVFWLRSGKWVDWLKLWIVKCLSYLLLL